MIENNWDYLFYSYKANLPLNKNYRNDLDKLHKAVNTIVESELKQRVKDELEELKKIVELEQNRHLRTKLLRKITSRIKHLNETFINI